MPSHQRQRSSAHQWHPCHHTTHPSLSFEFDTRQASFSASQQLSHLADLPLFFLSSVPHIRTSCSVMHSSPRHSTTLNPDMERVSKEPSKLNTTSKSKKKVAKKPKRVVTSIKGETVQEYKVSSIIEHRGGVGHRQMKVRWAGWGPEGDTWQDEVSLREDVPQKVQAYLKRKGIGPVMICSC